MLNSQSVVQRFDSTLVIIKLSGANLQYLYMRVQPTNCTDLAYPRHWLRLKLDLDQ